MWKLVKNVWIPDWVLFDSEPLYFNVHKENFSEPLVRIVLSFKLKSNKTFKSVRMFSFIQAQTGTTKNRFFIFSGLVDTPNLVQDIHIYYFDCLTRSNASVGGTFIIDKLVLWLIIIVCIRNWQKNIFMRNLFSNKLLSITKHPVNCNYVPLLKRWMGPGNSLEAGTRGRNGLDGCELTAFCVRTRNKSKYSFHLSIYLCVYRPVWGHKSWRKAHFLFIYLFQVIKM